MPVAMADSYFPTQPEPLIVLRVGLNNERSRRMRLKKILFDRIVENRAPDYRQDYSHDNT